MFSLFLHILAFVLFIPGAISFMVAIFFILICMGALRITRTKAWEDRATMFGLIALASLPVGGVGGSLFVVYHMMNKAWPGYDNWLVLLGGASYGIFALVAGVYLIRKTKGLD